jgi:hypothetical protein
MHKKIGIKLYDDHWYKHVQKSVETNRKSKVTILWNQQVQTDRTIPNNKQNSTIHANENGTCMLIDVAVSKDRNLIKKEAKKILKYKHLFVMPSQASTAVVVLYKGFWGFFFYINTLQQKHSAGGM